MEPAGAVEPARTFGSRAGRDWHDNASRADCARGHFTAYRGLITVYRPGAARPG